MRTGQPVPGAPGRDVDALRVIASALGVCAGVSGLDHGFFEAIQGNATTPGLFVQAIGPAQRFWVYGTEDAFTLVPNFLATGILALAVGVLIIGWSTRFIDRPNGPTVFLSLGGLLFLVGGGVAQVAFVVVCWAVSLRIGRPPAWPQKLGSIGFRRALSRRWLSALVASLTLAAFALEIAIFGFVPGVTDPDQRRLICWSALGMMAAVLVLAIAAGSLHDSHRSGGSSVLAPTRRIG